MTWQNIATTSGSQDVSTKTGINQPLQRSPPAKSHHSTLSWHVCNFQKGSASPRPKSPNEWYGNQAQPGFAWLMRVCFQYNWWKQRYPWYPTQGWCFLMGYIKQASFRSYISKLGCFLHHFQVFWWAKSRWMVGWDLLPGITSHMRQAVPWALVGAPRRSHIAAHHLESCYMIHLLYPQKGPHRWVRWCIMVENCMGVYNIYIIMYIYIIIYI